jgi:hypothetical protein
MRSERPSRLRSACCVALALFAAVAVLPGASWARSSAQQTEPRGDADDWNGPNFVFIPIHTELQRKLVANGKSIQALVLLNGYALLGKRGELMRNIDALPLQKSLAAFRATHPTASLALIIGYYGPASREQFQLSQKNRDAIEKTVRLVAGGAKAPVTYVSSTYDSTPGRWEKTVAGMRAIDLAKETAEEAPAGDADVRAFPVQTKVTRLLTAYYRGNVARGADCVVYVNKPIEAKNDPLIGADLEAKIASAIKSLHLSEKHRIDFHLVPASPNRAAGQRNRDAIDKRFLGKESQQLTERLGFKDNSITW